MIPLEKSTIILTEDFVIPTNSREPLIQPAVSGPAELELKLPEELTFPKHTVFYIKKIVPREKVLYTYTLFKDAQTPHYTRKPCIIDGYVILSYSIKNNNGGPLSSVSGIIRKKYDYNTYQMVDIATKCYTLNIRMDISTFNKIQFNIKHLPRTVIFSLTENITNSYSEKFSQAKNLGNAALDYINDYSKKSVYVKYMSGGFTFAYKLYDPTKNDLPIFSSWQERERYALELNDKIEHFIETPERIGIILNDN